MLLTVSSLRVFAGLTAAQLALSESVLRQSSWHDPLVGSAFGFVLGIALFAPRLQHAPRKSDVQPYRLTA